MGVPAEWATFRLEIISVYGVNLLPPPQFAVLLVIVLFWMVGLEPAQWMPPPKIIAELVLMLLFLIAGEDLLRQQMPPP